MSQLRRAFLAIALACTAAAAFAATGPYDEAADAKAQVQAALADAHKARVPVLVVFGANWCPDCRVLDMAFKDGTAAPLIQQHFRVVKVDVGRFNKNTDLAERFGVPLKKGIPAVAVLGDEGRVLYTTRSGELADARAMGDKGIYDFFTKVVSQAK